MEEYPGEGIEKSVQAEKLGWGGTPGLSRSQDMLGLPSGEDLGAG